MLGDGLRRALREVAKKLAALAEDSAEESRHGKNDMIKAFMFLHILGGSLAIAGGYAALFARKGGAVHRSAGMLFVYAMLAMGIGAAVVGLARDKPAWLGGPMVVYFVITATRTVRRGSRPNLLLDDQRGDRLISGSFVASLPSRGR